MAESYGTTSFELLAPAGSFSILKEVIAAGADAVYVGGSRFGARAYAQNFSDEELCEAIDYAHLYGRKLYLAVNTLLKNPEMDDLCDYIRPFYERGLDAVIVQDLGVIRLLRRAFPDLPLHASTQMTITGSDGARMLGEFGISRVVLSRELSIAEMARIHKETGMELEVFVHGALCYSYSGQCLFSSMLGGRSGNRGRCAQPCRLPYQVCTYNFGEQKEFVQRKGFTNQDEFVKRNESRGKKGFVQQGKSSYLLSLKDLCGIENLAALRDAGVYSLKIEGRMKQAAYAAGVTAYYRKYIDQLQTDQEYRVTAPDRRGLLALGNRSGFTDGYYHKRNGSDMVTVEKPAYNSSGEMQTSGQTKKIPVVGYASFHIGKESGITVTAGSSPESAMISATTTGAAPQAAAKQPVTEEQIRQRLQKTGDTLFEFKELTVDADEGIFIPNGELNRMRREVLAQLLEKMLAPYRRRCNGDSVNERVLAEEIFQADSDIEDQMNREHSDIMDQMSQEHSDGTDQMSQEHSDGTDNMSLEQPVDIECFKNDTRLIASVSSPEQLDAVLADGRITDIYLETVCYTRSKMMELLRQEVATIVASASETIPSIFLALPPVFRAHTESFYSGLADELRQLPLCGFLVRNYEEFAWVKRLFPDYRCILDASLYTYNDEAAKDFARLGADGNTVPFELNRREIMERYNRYSEMVVYGYYPLMVSAQCVHANVGARRTVANKSESQSLYDRDCVKQHTADSGEEGACDDSICDRKPGITRIRDRKGIEFPVCNFCSECVNVVYNSVPTVLFTHMEELMRTGIRGFRLNFTIEDADMVRTVLRLLPNTEETKHRDCRIDFPYTNGHYTRGVE